MFSGSRLADLGNLTQVKRAPIDRFLHQRRGAPAAILRPATAWASGSAASVSAWRRRRPRARHRDDVGVVDADDFVKDGKSGGH